MSCEPSADLYRELFGDEDSDSESLDLSSVNEPLAQAVEEPIPGLVINRGALDSKLCERYFTWLSTEYFSESSGQKRINQGMHFGPLTDSNTPLGYLAHISLKLQILPSTVSKRAVVFDQGIINLYDSGEGIGDHVDLLRFDDGVVGFSFGDAATMRFRRVGKTKEDMERATKYAQELDGEDREEIRIRVAAGDVYALSGEARYLWTHGIPGQIDGQSNVAERRISDFAQAVRVFKESATERVVSSAEFINKHSLDVHVPEEGVRRAAQEILSRMQSVGYSTAEWKKHTLTPSVADQHAIEWIFVVDALNFSFWSDKQANEQYTVTLDGQTYRGYWTLCAAVNRALREGIPITDARYYSQASSGELEHVFRGDSSEKIPMLEERIRVLREVGGVLVDRYGGRFGQMLEESGGSAQRLVGTVVEEFSSFRDEHQFEGRTVAMYKRAQILVADIWACFEGKGSGQFEDIDRVTMFADYRVPQALCHFGALEYSPQLRRFLEQSESAVRGVGEQQAECSPPAPGMLPSGHRWEVEIRGNSIWAVERIRQHIRQTAQGTEVNAILIDFYMWDYSKENAQDMQDIPIHLTRSVFY
ncbi:hypothetical protein EV174_002056 [Coemansia sp. RSA 2320]|nr:hypothetical protein EV174_002056 [Coemansia sp. RSA 2320]